MNFPTIIEEPCASDIPGSGGASGNIPSLVLKPGLIVGCAGGGVGLDTSRLIVTEAGDAVNGEYLLDPDTGVYTNTTQSAYEIRVDGDTWVLTESSSVAYRSVTSELTGLWQVNSGEDEGAAPPPTVVYGTQNQFRTFLKTDNAGETEVTSGVVYQSSNPAVVAIDGSTGSATLVSAGIATITATFGTLTAFAQVEVMGDGDGDDCCSDQTVRTLVAVDNSLSMGMSFDGSTRLTFAKLAAIALFDAMRWDKDTAGLAKFNFGLNVVAGISSPPIDHTTVNSIEQSTGQTDFLTVLQEALEGLQAEEADRLVLVIISDGENRPTASGSIPSPTAVLDLATAFKNAGGIIVCVGCAAAADGFALLQAMASGGFFVNAYNSSTSADALTSLVGFLCYYCGGLPPAYGNCLSQPIGEQLPAPVVLPDPELSSAHLYTSTKQACVACGTAGTEVLSLVPVMTDYSLPSGTVFYDPVDAFGANNAWKAFDGDPLTTWVTPSVNAAKIGYHFTSGQTVKNYALTTSGDYIQTGAPKSWTFEGSNNGTTWTVLDTQTNVPAWLSSQRRQYDFTNVTSYTYYRLNVSATQGNLPTQNVYLAAIEMYGVPVITRCASATASSYESQADADDLALAAAQVAAAALCGASNNTDTIQFNNGTLAPATPYPSIKEVSGLVGTITKVTVTLPSVKRPDGAPVMLLLVSPVGTAVMLWYVTADTVSRPFNSVQIVLDGTAGSFLPFETGLGPIAAGTYKQTVLESGESVALPLPAPQGTPYSKLLSTFNGESPNGTWRLYAAHKNYYSIFSPANNQLIGGWDLTITTA